MRDRMLLVIPGFRQSPQNYPELGKRIHWTKKVKEHISFALRANRKFVPLEQSHFWRQTVLMMSNPVHAIGQNGITGNKSELLKKTHNCPLPLGPLFHETKRWRSGQSNKLRVSCVILVEYLKVSCII